MFASDRSAVVIMGRLQSGGTTGQHLTRSFKMRPLTMAMVCAIALASFACRPATPPTPSSTPVPAVTSTATPAPQPTSVPTAPEKENTMAPEKTSAALHPQVLMQTSAGDFTLELDGEKAPISTLNFVQYVKDGYYKGVIFHRVIPNFMVQGGGMTPDFSDKTQGQRPSIKNEWRNGLKNVRGSISMARGGEADSATSQFFINVVDNDFLDQPRDGAAYAVFGKVIKGMDVVDKIRNAPGAGERPINPVVINDAKLVSDFDQPAVEKLAQR